MCVALPPLARALASHSQHHNFFPFSTGGLKNDFGGHNNHHHHNVYYNQGSCMYVCDQKPGHEDAFYNNTCVMTRGEMYAGFGKGIGGPALPIMHDNRVFTTTGNVTEGWGGGMGLAQWQAQGHDLGTTAAALPTDAAALAMGRAILGM